MTPFPLGKLPPEMLEKVLGHAPIIDPRVKLGPGIGLDCAVVGLGDTCLVFKSDPITFATHEIGWYAVQVNANDIATTGAIPRWFLMTLLLPESGTTPESVDAITNQVYEACTDLGVSVIGGHTEVTYGLDRPIIAGTMVGEVSCNELITPKGCSPGNRILLTKGVPIEGTAILAREFPDRLKDTCTAEEIKTANHYLYSPGISVVREAHMAVNSGHVTAMHDPTEGGLAGALWELAAACEHRLVIDPHAIPISPLSQKICNAFEIDPLRTIASGALLLTTPPSDAQKICNSLVESGTPCVVIGTVESGQPEVVQSTNEGFIPLPCPARDEIARVFEG